MSFNLPDWRDDEPTAMSGAGEVLFLAVIILVNAVIIYLGLTHAGGRLF